MELKDLKVGNVIRVKEDFYVNSYEIYKLNASYKKYPKGCTLIVLKVDKMWDTNMIEFTSPCFLSKETCENKSNEEIIDMCVEKIKNDSFNKEEKERFSRLSYYLGIGTKSFKKLFEVIK